MSSSRWAVSIFIVWYLTSLVVAAIPVAGVGQPVQPIQRISHTPYDSISARLTPWFDSAAVVVSSAAARAYASLKGLRPLTGDLLGQAGMAQRWDMFSNPPREPYYLRVKWYVSGGGEERGGRPLWTATRLVLPTHREDRVRGLASFRNFSMDRTMAGALDRSHPSGNPADTASIRTFEAALRPAVHYLTREFERARLEQDERITRIEVWHGAAEVAPPDAPPAVRERRALRLIALRNYADGAIEEPVITTKYPPYFAVQAESDIVWTLEYIEDR